MSGYIGIPNFEKWQHYKDRTPPWIKLHASLLRDYDFTCLQDASKAHLMLIWVLASQMENKIPNDPAYIQRLIGSSHAPDIELLISLGFLEIISCAEQAASKPLAERKQLDVVETETETDKKNTKKKISRSPKISLAEWEEKNGQINPGMLEDFAKKHKLTPSHMANLVDKFRSKCKASDYRYVHFDQAFESWTWGDELKKNPDAHWLEKPQNRMPSPAGG